ncbi:MAG: hypothetical protein QOK48_3131, partial [Blastocatellia bacterium]|nr:hypothetical protein [Blastocatellia bacterium]
RNRVHYAGQERGGKHRQIMKQCHTVGDSVKENNSWS